MGPSLWSPTAFSDLGQGRDYPNGLSDAKMFEAGGKVKELGT